MLQIPIFLSDMPVPPPITTQYPEKVNADTALLENTIPVRQPRYGNSEFQQFFIILSRALLFSRRDWVIPHFVIFT